MEFRKANPNEVDAVLPLLKEAALWLQEKGIDYWQNWINPATNFTNWISQGFSNDEFYIVEDDTKSTIGCFRLQWSDPMFWGERNDEAGYIHSFTVSRHLAGRGIGSNVLNLIESYCKRRNKAFLRLDCGEVERLKRYYENNGFNPVGEVTVLSEKLNLYEKRL